jgi:hypothetical protein
MKPIPQELIYKMPDDVEASTESCQEAADAVLHVLFLMGAELDPKMTWPPVVSNGVELWPMPAPYQSGERRQIRLLVDLNGGGAEEGGYLAHCKRNVEEFNEALEDAKPEVAEEIASMGPTDSAHIWNYLNALACSVESESVFRPLELSDECKRSYYLALGLGS